MRDVDDRLLKASFVILPFARRSGIGDDNSAINFS